MRTIRNSFLVLMTLSLATIFTSCGGQKNEATGPKQVAQSFLDKMATGDFEGAKEFATDASRQNLDMMASMGDDGMGECTVTDVKVDGDNATATYSMKNSDKSMSMDMVKVDGNWKVKFEQPMMDMGGDDQNMDNGADTTMNSDSGAEMNEDHSKSDMEEEKTQTDKTSGEKTNTMKPEKRGAGQDDSKTMEKTPTKK